MTRSGARLEEIVAEMQAERATDDQTTASSGCSVTFAALVRYLKGSHVADQVPDEVATVALSL
jgi:hypothetical protein